MEKNTADEINKFDADYWTPSVGSRVLGNKLIMDLLGSIDPTTLDKDVMLELEALMASDDFSFILVENSCQASKGLFNWVRAVRNYYYVYKANEPHRDKVIKSDL
jgi:hypothetical protein